MEEGEPAVPSSSSVVIRNRDFKNNNNNKVSKTGAKRKLPSTSIASQKSESRIRGRIHQNGEKNIRKRKGPSSVIVERPCSNDIGGPVLLSRVSVTVASPEYCAGFVGSGGGGGNQWRVLEQSSYSYQSHRQETTTTTTSTKSPLLFRQNRAFLPPPPSNRSSASSGFLDRRLKEQEEDEDEDEELSAVYPGNRKTSTPPPAYLNSGESNSFAGQQQFAAEGAANLSPVARSPSPSPAGFGGGGGGYASSGRALREFNRAQQQQQHLGGSRPQSPVVFGQQQKEQRQIYQQQHQFSQPRSRSRPSSPTPSATSTRMRRYSTGAPPPPDSPRISERRFSHTPSQAPFVEDSSTMFTCFKGGRSLQVLINMVLLVSSLVLIGTGAGLLGFYRIHMLDVITIEFLIVPLILVVGGIFTMLTSLFGFYVAFRDDSCLMVTYSVFLSLEFIVLIAGIIASVRLLFDIQTGLFDADVIPELGMYETDPWVRYKWDTLQREFSCCGGYGYTLGYQDWKHTVMGGARNSVPDSCCLQEAPSCGKNIFAITDLRVVIQKIHTHGCLTTMLRRLETHVNVILLVFAVVGGFLAVIELLGVVLSCCMASRLAEVEREEEEAASRMGGGGGWGPADYDYDPREGPGPGMGGAEQVI